MLHLRGNWPSERRLPLEENSSVKKLAAGCFDSAQNARGLVATIRHVGPKLLTIGQLYGQEFTLQIDTGAQCSLIPEKYISPEFRSFITPAKIQLQGYDGTGIKTFGAIKGDLKIGKIMLKNCIFIVVENHLTPILGTPELEENEIVIDTKNRKILQRNIDAEIFTAQGGKNGNIKIVEKKAFFTTQAKNNETISLPPKKTSIINLQLDSTPTNHIYALPEKITKNKNLEIYPQCIKVNKLDASIKIQIGNNSAIPINLDKNTTICRIAKVSVGVPETGKLEKVMKELQIGDVPKSIRQNLKMIISEYVDVFAVENEKLGKTVCNEFLRPSEGGWFDCPAVSRYVI